MAEFYPAIAPERSPNSELKVRKALMPVPGIIVFHSIGWQSRRNNKPGDGEADFILLVPGHGLVILEVKGGGVEIINGSWYTTNAAGKQHRIKDPFEQAKDSKFALLEFFKQIRPELRLIPLIHGVCFPDIVVESGVSMNGPRELILDREDLSDPTRSLQRLANHWKVSHAFTTSKVKEVIELLAPTVTIRRTLNDDIQDAEKALIRLTNQQVEVLHGMGRNKRAIISGGAGTGKTLLAIEKARQSSEHGLKTLLVCYNGPLKEHLKKATGDLDIDVESFHSLVVREAKKAKLRLPVQLDQNWFDNRAIGDMLDALEINQTKYDAVIVDEAQDFSTEWIDSILFFTRGGNSLVYLFADSHQDLYSRGWKVPQNFAAFDLTRNCRNTAPIAKKVGRIFSDTTNMNEAEGPDPVFIEIEKFDQYARRIILTMETLLVSERLAPEQVVVLSDSSRILEDLRTTGVGDYLFTDLTGKGVAVESIQRFKGLERDVVVIAFTQAALERDFKALAYVALSRAKSALYILGSSAIRKALAWD